MLGGTFAHARVVAGLAERVSSLSLYRPTGLFQAVCSTDVMFLLDATYSMYDYINAARDHIKTIVRDTRELLYNEAEARVGVVGYRDQGDSVKYEIFGFTTDADRVYRFLHLLRAEGGGDVPEDVIGDPEEMLNASWKHETRCRIHIADAPPHSRRLQSL